MGNYNMNCPGKKIIKGCYGTYELLESLGHGGNGEVFNVKVLESKGILPSSNRGYVIKILNRNNSPKGVKRFIKEIQTVLSLQEKIDGIIPIFDHCNISNTRVKGYAWYLMPKAENYNSKEYNEKDKLEQMLAVCNTLIELHKIDIVHRDIKPANLLMYKGELCLSDFGLVCTNRDINHITGISEKLGPKGLRPPEFNNEIERTVEYDYKKADVYLFAKTLWMILTNKSDAFSGTYERNIPHKYLNVIDFDIGKTLEPLHELFETATQYYPEDRKSMQFCAEKINLQLSVLEERINVNSLMFDEAINECDKQIDADEKILTDVLKIEKAISKMEGISSLIISEYSENVNLGLLISGKYINNRIFLLKIKNQCRRIVQIFMEIDRFSIMNNNSRVCIGITPISQSPIELVRCSSLREISSFLEVDKYMLDGNFIIDLIKG